MMSANDDSFSIQLVYDLQRTYAWQCFSTNAYRAQKSRLLQNKKTSTQNNDHKETVELVTDLIIPT